MIRFWCLALQMFEGLGLGTRKSVCLRGHPFGPTFDEILIHPGLAFLRLERQYSWIPWLGACLYSLCTPIGMAIGLGVREGLVRTAGAQRKKAFSDSLPPELLTLLGGMDRT